MHIEEKALADIIGYKDNPKAHSNEQVQRIAKSIELYGFVQPILLDSNNVIIAGHGRYEAAFLLDLKKVPVIYAKNLTENEVRAYRLLDNKLNESEWDIENLAEDLKSCGESEKGFFCLVVQKADPVRQVDTSSLEDDLARREENPMKQLIFYLDEAKYDEVTERLEALQDDLETYTHSETFLALLEKYHAENSVAIDE